MLFLSLESSCDETAAAVFTEEPRVLASVIASQTDLHARFGGVVPEVAARAHLQRLLPVVDEALQKAGVTLEQIGCIAVHHTPGLVGALLVGAAFARGLAFALRVPAIGIHHLEGHLLSPLLSARKPEFPFVALLVSGGHTQLMRVDAVGRYTVLGETQDDAAGEAFDKTAKLLGLGYPGGPALAQLAEAGTPGRHRLPRPMIASGDLDFSFSGLKTAVATLVKSAEPDAQFRVLLHLHRFRQREQRGNRRAAPLTLDEIEERLVGEEAPPRGAEHRHLASRGRDPFALPGGFTRRLNPP